MFVGKEILSSLLADLASAEPSSSLIHITSTCRRLVLNVAWAGVRGGTKVGLESGNLNTVDYHLDWLGVVKTGHWRRGQRGEREEQYRDGNSGRLLICCRF